MKISVCLLTYHNDSTKDEALQSIMNQNYKDYEIITREDEEGKGLASNLNSIVTQTSGEIVVFLAGDDYLLPNALENIAKEFSRNDHLGVAARTYYWFKDDWRIPVRKTKMRNFTTPDLIFLCGQMSGMAVRKSCLTFPFKEKRFVEFASGVLPIMNDYDAMIIAEPTVAVRIDSSDSFSSKCYEQSWVENWHEIFKENFSKTPNLLNRLNEILSHNFIGLLQVRMYGDFAYMREIRNMMAIDPFILASPKFWFYFFLLQLPPKFLRKLRDIFLYGINRRLCK